jgi:HlyD family secretion protein
MDRTGIWGRGWVLLAAVMVLVGCASSAKGGATTAEPTRAAVKAGNTVTAQGKVVPVRSAALGVLAGGLVAEVKVAEGDSVTQGQVLLRLQAAREGAALSQAEAALALAEAQLARTKAGARAEDVAVAEAALVAARANVVSAEAAVAAASADAKTAEAAVLVARQGITNAQSGVGVALANLRRAQSGPTADDVAIAEHRVEAAKNALWGAQAERDAICGRVRESKGVPSGVSKADCDNANAGVQGAQEQVSIASLTLQQVKDGPREQDIAVTAAQVEQARSQVGTAEAQAKQVEGQMASAQVRIKQLEGQLASAKAQVSQSEAALARARAGATPEDIAVAEAGVQQARAAVDSAQVAVSEREIRAPFAGIVGAVDTEIGEQLLPGTAALQLAADTGWQIETDDLTELSVGKLQPGEKVTLTFDAIPGLSLSGNVVRIRPIGENKRGDITYTVVIAPEQQDPRLRWNMTATVVK